MGASSDKARIDPATAFAGLEFMTTSSTTEITDSNYTPTDFQSAISTISSNNRGFGNGYSSSMFEPLLSDIFSSSKSSIVDTPSQQTESPMLDTNTEESFPFATRPVDVQPFMASVDDEWFYEYLSSQMAADPAPAPAPAPAPPPPPLSMLPPNRTSPLLCDLSNLSQPATEELQHYRDYLDLMRNESLLTELLGSLPIFVCVSKSSARSPCSNMGRKR